MKDLFYKVFILFLILGVVFVTWFSFVTIMALIYIAIGCFAVAVINFILSLFFDKH